MESDIEPLWTDLADVNIRLRAQLNAMQKQRDETNANLRNACVEIAQRVQYPSRTGEQIAIERGWKCYE